MNLGVRDSHLLTHDFSRRDDGNRSTWQWTTLHHRRIHLDASCLSRQANRDNSANLQLTAKLVPLAHRPAHFGRPRRRLWFSYRLLLLLLLSPMIPIANIMLQKCWRSNCATNPIFTTSIPSCQTSDLMEEGAAGTADTIVARQSTIAFLFSLFRPE